MHELMILDHTGHKSVPWDPASAQAVATARDAFNAARQAGYLAYTIDAGGSGTVVKDFDPNAEKTVLAPPMVGG